MRVVAVVRCEPHETQGRARVEILDQRAVGASAGGVVGRVCERYLVASS